MENRPKYNVLPALSDRYLYDMLIRVSTFFLLFFSYVTWPFCVKAVGGGSERESDADERVDGWGL